MRYNDERDDGDHEYFRQIIGYEDRPTGDRRRLIKGSVTWDTPCPIIMDSERVGQILHIQREGDALVALIDIELPEGMVLSLSGTDASFDIIGDWEETGEYAEIVFNKLRVAGACILPKNTWCWQGQDGTD